MGHQIVQQESETANESRAGIFSRDGLTLAARVMFFAALIGVLYFAWTPAPPTLLGNDKSQHMLAFAVLMILFRLAWPQWSWRGALVWFGALGAVIELVQAIPALHRDCDINDWFADMAAVVAALAVIAVVDRLIAKT
jgi:hypothetical protein